MKNFPIKWAILAVATVILLIAGTIMIEISTVRGNQIGIKETWTGGVEDYLYPPKTYFLFPGYSQRIYNYDMTPHVFTLDGFEASSSDNQTVKLRVAAQWHYDHEKIIEIHKQYHTHVDIDGWEDIIEDKIIRRNVIGAITSAVTARTAIDGYSGPGFGSMQAEINKAVTDPQGEIRQQGIIIENVVIESRTLDADYIGEINKRQVAQQRKLRADEETKAAEAEALRAKAEAGADYEKRVVEAKRDAQVEIEASKAAAQKRNNEADAAAYQVTTAANAERSASEARAAAIKALGAAEAEAQRLRLSAYAVPGADQFVQIEVSKSMAEAFKNINGYLPEKMTINLLSDNFMSAVRSVVGGHGIVAPTVR